MQDHSDESELASLERFVVDNDDLLELEETIGRFNVFDALGVAEVEIRHSNFLAWLLDPNESHGQGALFLSAWLMDLLRQSPPELRPFSPIEVDGVDLRGVEVRREWRHIDLLVACEEPAFVLAVENKVRSTEHGDQLARYRQIVAEAFPDRQAFFVFLTVDGDEPSDERWVPYTYSDLHRVLTRTHRTHGGSIGDDVGVFLGHYLRLIGSRFMDDPKIDELCQRIYRNHRQALQLIFERVGSEGGALLQAIHDRIAADSRWHVFNRTSRRVEFVPREWIGMLPPIAHRRSGDPSLWLVLKVFRGPKACRLFCEAHRASDTDVRQAVVDRLIRDPDEFGFRILRKATEARWNRLLNEKLVALPEDDEVDVDAVMTALDRRLDALAKRIAGVPAALRPILDGRAATTKPPG